MSPAGSLSRRIQATEAGEPEDKRLHRRFGLALSGRFMRADKSEQVCRVKDISVGGVALTIEEGATSVPVGERIVAYIEHLGGLEGQVIRSWNDGFACKLIATQHKREKIAAQITWLLNEQDMIGASARQHERIVINNRNAEITITGGVCLPCLILDVSVSGASVACKVKPDIDTEVWLGRLRAHVVRHHQEGVGLQFMEILDVDTLQAHFG